MEDVGVRRYTHLIDAANMDSNGCNPSFLTCNLFKGSYALIVRGTTFQIAKANRDFIFDAEAKLLIRPDFRIRGSTYVNPHRATD